MSAKSRAILTPADRRFMVEKLRRVYRYRMARAEKKAKFWTLRTAAASGDAAAVLAFDMHKHKWRKQRKVG